VTKTITELNKSFCSLLNETVGSDRYQLWFSSPDAFTFDQTRLYINCDTEFHLDRIKSQFSSAIQVTAQQFGIQSIAFRCQEPLDIQPDGPVPRPNRSAQRLGVGDSPQPVAQSELKPAELKPAELKPANLSMVHSEAHLDRNAPCHSSPSSFSGSNSSAAQRYALEHFEFDQNDLVRTGIEMVLHQPGQLSPLTFFGNCGSGKTHLLRGLYDQVRRMRIVGRSLYLTAEQFTTQFVSSINGKGLAIFRQKCRDVDMLFVDDVHHFAGKTATITEFQYTIDTLLRRSKQIVLASAIAPSELEYLGSALANRLASGLTCQVRVPGAEGRLRILQNWCRQRSIKIEKETLQLIANRVNHDIRKLSGCLNMVHATQLVNRTPLNADQAEIALQELLPFAKRVSLSQIEKVVCETCGVDAGDLKSRRKQTLISSARMLAIWLSRKHTGAALTEIGNYFGGRSHSTVVAAKKTVESWLKEDRTLPMSKGVKPVQSVIERIEAELRVG
jgi:chromosomal replication initiator protein